MKLSKFIQENRVQILQQWESFAADLFPEMNPKLLRDHAEELLTAIVRDMESPQSHIDQQKKAEGKLGSPELVEKGAMHAVHRLETGFSLFQLVSEYRFLRASTLRMWQHNANVDCDADCEGITRFNESIDEALVEAVTEYSAVAEKHRHELLSILGHDLRNPIGAVIMGGTVLTLSESLSDKDARIATRIVNSAKRMQRMIDYLLDLIRIKAGKKLPITTTYTDIEMVCRLVLSEVELNFPNFKVNFESHGNLHGRWDGDRLAQVISNIITNAIQHSYADHEVTIRAFEDYDHSVVVEVHNFGKAIAPKLITTIFEQMITDDAVMSSGLGLGLYIAKEIVESHRGCITVSSTDADGTTFSVRLPRESASQRPSNCPPAA